MRLHPKDWLALGFADPVNDISLTMRSTRMRILQIRSIGTDRSRMIGSMGVGAFTVCAMASSPERISAAIAIPCTLHSSSEETTYESRIRASASFVSAPVRPANGSRNASPSAPQGRWSLQPLRPVLSPPSSPPTTDHPSPVPTARSARALGQREAPATR